MKKYQIGKYYQNKLFEDWLEVVNSDVEFKDYLIPDGGEELEAILIDQVESKNFTHLVEDISRGRFKNQIAKDFLERSTNYQFAILFEFFLRVITPCPEWVITNCVPIKVTNIRGEEELVYLYKDITFIFNSNTPYILPVDCRKNYSGLEKRLNNNNNNNNG